MIKFLRSSQVKFLNKIGAISSRIFIILGIASMGIALLGSFAVGIIAGIFGTRNFVNIIFAISGFTAALACFALSLAFFVLLFITVIQLKFESLKPRIAISGFVAYSFAFVLSLGVGFCAVWWGIKMITGVALVE